MSFVNIFKKEKWTSSVFYVEPSVAFKSGGSSQTKSESSSSASTPGSDNRSLGSANTNSVASVSRPVSNIQTVSSAPSLNGVHQMTSIKLSPSVDLLSSLGNSSNTAPKTQSSDKDPFSTAVTLQNSEGFANFDNANIFSSASISKPSPNPHPPFSSNPLTPLSSSSKSVSTSTPNNVSSIGLPNNSNPSVSEDRYAALKDLDEAFKFQKEVDKPPGNNSAMFGSPPTGTGQPQAGNALFGTSPISTGGGNFYPNSSLSNQGWNAAFPSANPFSGNGTSNANLSSPWANGSKFGSSSTQVQQQANPFAGGADPNFNSQFISGFGGTPSNNNNNNANGNWSNFGNSSNVQNGPSKLSTNPWGPNSAPNPFNVPPVVPSSGSSYNPFL